MCTVLIAYPMAYLSVRSKKSWIRTFVTGGVLVPYWVSMLVRIFAWQIILAKNGLLNTLLMKLGIIDEPLVLLYNSIAVVISLTHILLPQMFLSMQSVMAEIDGNLTLAAEGMGAKPVTNFRTVFLPLSVPGIVSGCMMVFVLALGFYIAPGITRRKPGYDGFQSDSAEYGQHELAYSGSIVCGIIRNRYGICCGCV